MPDCTRLSELDGFNDYAKLIEEETAWKSTELEHCQFELCSAVYGTGNPDISGIGVALGYIFATGISALLSLVAVVVGRWQSARAYRAAAATTTGLQSFYQSATYFAIAVQLATISSLTHKDFGISTSDFGAIEAQIAQAVSVVCMLPLLAPLVLLDGIDGESWRNPRLFLLHLVVALSFYPFLSRCIQWFAPSPIGDGRGAVVSFADWNTVERICFADGLDKLRDDSLYASAGILELLSSLVVYLFTLWYLLGLIGTGHGARKGKIRSIHAKWNKLNAWIGGRFYLVLMLQAIPFVLSILLYIIIFRLRSTQQELVTRMTIGYNGNNWGFGQIIATVIFLPVFIDVFYSLWLK
ncbi:hypothetical protein B0I35DRAFT_268106 [Stachybotrys elegans]|uniref:Uncharacterized protein n=1 Tax=Stachybotrys elegans TaxID=80388 RepID=A0A8K0SLA9_9HYPO|nr:hypothetical protein B0I35DRAFT_268106 [Stachybotrys elegans]